MKFRMAKQTRLPKLMSTQKSENFIKQVHRRRLSRKSRKIAISFYSLHQNSEYIANNRFHAKLVNYSNFSDIFADVWPILMKICMMTHISYPDQDRGCCRLKKLSNAISQLLCHWLARSANLPEGLYILLMFFLYFLKKFIVVATVAPLAQKPIDRSSPKFRDW